MELQNRKRSKRILFYWKKECQRKSEANLMLALNGILQQAGKKPSIWFCHRSYKLVDLFWLFIYYWRKFGDVSGKNFLYTIIYELSSLPEPLQALH